MRLFQDQLLLRLIFRKVGYKLERGTLIIQVVGSIILQYLLVSILIFIWRDFVDSFFTWLVVIMRASIAVDTVTVIFILPDSDFFLEQSCNESSFD